MKNKVAVGISGGVDSAVTAFLLQKAGYEVLGVHLYMFDFKIDGSEIFRAQRDNAKKVAKYLGIELVEEDIKREFKKDIIDQFVKDYLDGRTPNPCIRCNKLIKSELFFQVARKYGADYISTGHYAISKNGELYKGIDEKKDQSYFLYMLGEEMLEKTIFPLGGRKKDSVKQIARNLGIPVFDRPESTEVCFLEGKSLPDFLDEILPRKEGDIIDEESGDTVGTHSGVWKYTIGQRNGLGIGGSESPYYISRKDSENNTLYVVQSKKNRVLWKKKIYVENFNFINEKDAFKESIDSFTCSIRYRMKPEECDFLLTVDRNNKISVEVDFRRDIWAPAIGQSLVAYKSNRCIGGGIITDVQ